MDSNYVHVGSALAEGARHYGREEIMVVVYLFIAFMVLEVIAIIVVYNQLRKRYVIVGELWANIMTVLAKRHAVVPRLISATQASSDFELNVQQSIAAARNGDVQETGKAESALQKNIVQCIEAYPAMRAQQNFQKIIDELVNIEDGIQGERLLYNAAVSEYNHLLSIFPHMLVAKAFGFLPQDYFEVEVSE
ncbi:LemA family protein [Candidatus Saccharibacteria bacterium]|jgi:LemA protein|nr:MAG: LemA family protein [Candidatus Saccharibacteria bacterium]